MRPLPLDLGTKASLGTRSEAVAGSPALGAMATSKAGAHAGLTGGAHAKLEEGVAEGDVEGALVHETVGIETSEAMLEEDRVDTGAKTGVRMP